MDRIKELELKVREYEERLGIGDDDPAREGYLVLVKLLKQQNKYLKSVTIEELIKSDDKTKQSEYDRAKGLWEKLPNFISAVSNLRMELKMDGEKQVVVKDKPIVASSLDEENM